jgi:sortase A
MTSRSAWRFFETSLLITAVTGIGLWTWSTAGRALYERWGSRVMRQAQESGAPEAKTLPNSLIGRIEIPRLDVTALVREGTGATTLTVAAGHIPGTAIPGQKGNVAVAAHRDSLFRGLQDVRKGDEIFFETTTGTHVYRVNSTQIVNPEDVGVLKPGPRPELTLVTCYPFTWVGSAPQRFIVKALEVSSVNSAPVRITRVEATTPPSPSPSVAPPPKRDRVYFQIPVGHSRQLAPGISAGITSVDPETHTAVGWMWLMPERRTVWLRQSETEFVSESDGKERHLVITAVSATAATGYLQLPG